MNVDLTRFLWRLRETQAERLPCIDCGKRVPHPKLRCRSCRLKRDRRDGFLAARRRDLPELFARYRRDHAERHR